MRTPLDRRDCFLLSACLVAALWLQPHSARADIDLRIGAKGLFVLSGLTDADGSETMDPPFFDASLGAGFGGGLYGELHASKLLGVELDLLLESNRLFFEGTRRGRRHLPAHHVRAVSHPASGQAVLAERATVSNSTSAWVLKPSSAWARARGRA